MKKKFNFIALLILIALASSFIVTIQRSIDDFVTGFNEGIENDDAYLPNTAWLDIVQEGNTSYDFTLNSKDHGEGIQFIPRSIIAKQTQMDSKTTNILFGISNIFILCNILTSICAIIFFVKFILAVNRGAVFEERLLFYLTILGWSLILSFASVVIVSMLFHQINIELFHIEGYKIVSSHTIPFFWLLAGLTILLVKQFIAIGIKLKEEQELTI